MSVISWDLEFLSEASVTHLVEYIKDWKKQKTPHQAQEEEE